MFSWLPRLYRREREFGSIADLRSLSPPRPPPRPETARVLQEAVREPSTRFRTRFASPSRSRRGRSPSAGRSRGERQRGPPPPPSSGPPPPPPSSAPPPPPRCAQGAPPGLHWPLLESGPPAAGRGAPAQPRPPGCRFPPLRGRCSGLRLRRLSPSPRRRSRTGCSSFAEDPSHLPAILLLRPSINKVAAAVEYLLDHSANQDLRNWMMKSRSDDVPHYYYDFCCKRSHCYSMEAYHEGLKK